MSGVSLSLASCRLRRGARIAPDELFGEVWLGNVDSASSNVDWFHASVAESAGSINKSRGGVGWDEGGGGNGRKQATTNNMREDGVPIGRWGCPEWADSCRLTRAWLNPQRLPREWGRAVACSPAVAPESRVNLTLNRGWIHRWIGVKLTLNLSLNQGRSAGEFALESDGESGWSWRWICR